MRCSAAACIARCGWDTEIGPGRHPVSSAYFWYFRNPAGALVEYYADEDQLTGEWQAREFEPGPTVFAEWAIAGGLDGNTRRQKASRHRRAGSSPTNPGVETSMIDTLLLTVLLRHDQSKNLDEIQARMKAMDWWERFPGEGVEIVSWTVAMGLGQIVTLRLPPACCHASTSNWSAPPGACSAPNATRPTTSSRFAKPSANGSALEANDMQDRYLEPHQARTREPNAFEDLLGDSIERAYAAGLHDLPGLLGYLNQAGPTCPGGGPWTEEAYKTLMARLGA